MSRSDWYFLGFALTILEACFMWWLAFVVWRRSKREFLNCMYALTLFCLGIWITSGFVDKILDNPGATFTLWTYRWAYASTSLGLVFFFLFLLAFYLGRTPAMKIVLPTLALGLGMAAISVSSLVIQSASYDEGTLVIVYGPLNGLMTTLMLLFSAACLFLLTRKWLTSSGIDRARASVMLLGSALFISVALPLTIMLPLITGDNFYVDYAFLAAAIPVGFTGYAVIRLRVLDTRIILRRFGVFVIGISLLILPLLALLILFSNLHLSDFVQWAVFLAAFCLLAYLAPNLWHQVERFSSRFFFAGLYDELHLLDEISSTLSSRSEMRPGLLEAMQKIVPALGLRELGLILLEEAVGGRSLYLRVSPEEDGIDPNTAREEVPRLDWLANTNGTIITEEMRRWPRDAEEECIGRELDTLGLAACVPVSAAGRRLAYLMVGKKVNARALSSTDISLLEKAGDRLGFFFNNYALSSQLAAQLEELGAVYERLREADAFKTEIIQVASHEFRTPVTIINGFAQTMATNWDRLSDEQRMTFIGSITSSCHRLTRLTDQFFTLSRYRDSESSAIRIPVRISKVLEDLTGTLSPEDRDRVNLELERDELITTDPDHLLTILSNILENALRFSPSEQPVIIRTWSDSMNIFIRIQDFGKGMPSQDSDRIFEPFVRLEDVRYHSQGMGLGLHIVRVLSTLLGADIEIESVPGSGTSVTITLGLR
jgi:signal transduction histidine kinase